MKDGPFTNEGFGVSDKPSYSHGEQFLGRILPFSLVSIHTNDNDPTIQVRLVSSLDIYEC